VTATAGGDPVTDDGEQARPAVEVEQLRVVRGGRPVLHGLDFTVARGRVTGLLGPSGCGKTTLMRSIVGVQRLDGGSVTVLGRPAGSRALRDRVGYVTQAPSVYDDLTVAENLTFFARVLAAPASRVAECRDLVGLGDEGRRLVGRLSGGQRSRVSLAVALLADPPLLVLDEPTVGLDPVLRRDLWRTFHRLADRGAAVLVSSHVMDEASRCDRLLLMREGRLVADDTPAALLARTRATDVEGAFLALVEGAGGEAVPS
jgi:ABC-2 type transport system ATP-binding protein